jgi:hypothetical protein
MWRDALFSATDGDRDATPASVGVRSIRVEPYVPTDVLQTEAVIVATMPLPETLPTTVRFVSAMQTTSTHRIASPESRSWDRLLAYLVLVAICATLGAWLSSLPAFQETRLLSGKLTAAMLPQLLGAGGVIFFFWMFGRGMALRFRAQGGPRAVLCDLLTPIVALIALVIAYALVQRPIAPLLDETASSIYARCFLLATCACAVWMSMTVFSHAEALRRLLDDYRAGSRDLDAGTSAWARPKEK